MRKAFTHFLLFVLLICPFLGFAQLNTELVGYLDYPDSKLNDVWAYVAPDGTEYALVGARKGVSVVSLADPSNPTEIAWIEGEESVWRDLKTNGSFAYVTTDQNGTKEGLLVIDLSYLPDGVSHYNFTPYLEEYQDTLYQCHNIFIDEYNYAYLSGCNVAGGATLVFDLSVSPLYPLFINQIEEVYSHDIYVRDNIAYSSNIVEGYFSIIDVADKQNPVLMGTANTPSFFTHNAWLSDDSQTIFTTDEKPNSATTSFDISDFEDIKELDQYRPKATLGTGVIPHNTHVFNDFLVTSHYSDGLIVVDAARPDNLVEVANYDTYPGTETGTKGCWGAYPFLPSGLVLATDIDTGLFVFDVDYRRAAYWEGKVVDQNTGQGIMNANITFNHSYINDVVSGVDGGFKVGTPFTETVSATVSVVGYYEKTVFTNLVNGEVEDVYIPLEPLPTYDLTGFVFHPNGDVVTPVPNVEILIENEFVSYRTMSNEFGGYAIDDIYLGDYTIYAGCWGYNNLFLTSVSITEDLEKDLSLTRGYEDNFVLDLGWEVTGDATNGDWELGSPVGTKTNSGTISNPFDDSDDDVGDYCYVTGNAGGSASFDQVENGTTILTSPLMDLTTFDRPFINYQLYLYNAWTSNDSLIVKIDNGEEVAVLEIIKESQTAWRPSSRIDVAAIIPITKTMRVIYEISDRMDSSNIVEGGVDNFMITESLWEPDGLIEDELVKMLVYPNPFIDEFSVDYKIKKSQYTSLQVKLFNVLGQEVFVQDLNSPIGTINFNENLQGGTYYLQLYVDDELTSSVKMLKVF